MNITVVGLGLIGGSFCKAISDKTDNTCYGIDTDDKVINEARKLGCISKNSADLAMSDLTIVSLYPEGTVNFINDNADKFKTNSTVIDTCGIKKYITENVYETLKSRGITFIGAHPMAGKEFSGFKYSEATLFEGASLILTPKQDVKEEKTSEIKKLGEILGFSKIVVTTDEEHDRIISYTSQLAHIVSSAYIKSPTQQEQSGFSAGSFKDLTRVAKLNEDMWTSLFMFNKENLIYEISEIIKNLNDYKSALVDNDNDLLKKLLKDGRILKEKSNLNYKNN